jgi:hypothetical protein
MKPLYTKEQFKNAKSNDLLPCECIICNTTFYKLKRVINRINNKDYKSDNTNSGNFCSSKCALSVKLKFKIVNCLTCNIQFEKKLCEIKKTKNNFCSRSCAATYNNKHKSYGNRRSKLEIYLEEQLTLIYPNLNIDYNKKDKIGSELDIYIPLLNLAIELNGIFHYEPIYGVDKLTQTQKNDISKSKACHDAKIDLCIIDTSSQKYVKSSTCKKYLDIITNIINQRTNLHGYEPTMPN